MFESNLTVEERTAMKAEAVERMKMLGLDKKCINAFEKHNKVWLSESFGLYNDEKVQNMVKDVESEKECLIYHVISNKIYNMQCYTMLCVCKHKEEWEMDREDIKDGYVFSYVLNVDAPDCSEFGSVVVKPTFGALRRIG